MAIHKQLNSKHKKTPRNRGVNYNLWIVIFIYRIQQ